MKATRITRQNVLVMEIKEIAKIKLIVMAKETKKGKYNEIKRFILDIL